MNSKSQNKLRFFLSFLIFFLLGTAGLKAAEHQLPEKPIVVLITSYNNQEFVRQNIASVLMQRYSNYRVIYIDDCSSDNTGLIARGLLKRFKHKINANYIRNEIRVGALANIYHAVHSCRDDEIIVSLDGDDWFPHKHVLQRINEAYVSPDVWLTHGSLIEFPNNSTAWSLPIPKEIVDSGDFRSYRCPSHLRTFYAWLFKQIRQEDLQYNGNFFPMTWDQAMMFPMIEMAGERHRFIPEVVYVYNITNSINDNKVNPQLQRDLEVYIRSLPRYQRLDKCPLE